MPLRLIQFRASDGGTQVAALAEDGPATILDGVRTTYELAQRALASGHSLAETAAASASAAYVDPEALAAQGALLPPIGHPDPAHCWLTGTGLTHLGSAEGRDKMHKAAAAAGALTDSMRMFQLGLEGGKPAPGQAGVQPEWFYKGDGSAIVGTGAPLVSPGFALDGSEEPEIAGIYIIDDAGTPRRLGFCLANEFSDHVTERGNYLWLAHSKLRPAALGAELLTGEMPPAITGTSRVLRDGAVIWEKPFHTGEAHMSHSLANLERHHFKYRLFRRPGDVHVHFFGTATLSFSDGIKTQPGDAFEISAPCFRLPLRNSLTAAPDDRVEVRPL